MSSQQNDPAVFVFDLDGTLVDSLPDIAAAMNRLLADLGRPRATLEEVGRWVGDGASLLVERALEAGGGLPPGRTVADLTAAYIAHYQGNAAHETKPYPGVVSTLERLAAAGHVMAVCTNKPRDLAIELLKSLDMLKFFRAVLGGDSVPAKKPDPGHLSAALQAINAQDNVARGRAVMVGDSRNDVLAARGVGIPVVAVSFGYGPVDPGELGADILIDDFSRLPEAAAALVA